MNNNGYALKSSHPSQPTYATLEITWDNIIYNCYQCMGVLGKDINNNTEWDINFNR